MLKRPNFFKCLFLLLFIAAHAAFSQGLSKKCFDELLSVPEKKQDFDLQNFLTKDFPAEVVKVKAQMKLPFGKPKDDKVTDIGVTVGCLKGFPENTEQIQAMLKDVSLEMAKLTVNKLGTNVLAGLQGATSIGTGIIAAKVSATPALKECDALFNTEKKFCYDGRVYDKCDGIIYNPTTHVCSEDVAYRAVCNEVQYNPLTQKCENNAVSATCGETEYNQATHKCQDNALSEFPKCGETAYNPETHGCGQNNVLLTKCGTLYYNPATQGCGEDNAVYPKCGANLYNYETHGCNNNLVLPKCGAYLYNSETHVCENNAVVSKQTYAEIAVIEDKQVMENVEDPEKSERKTRFGIRANRSFVGGLAGGGGGMFLLIPFYSIYFVPEISVEAKDRREYGNDIGEASI